MRFKERLLEKFPTAEAKWNVHHWEIKLDGQVLSRSKTEGDAWKRALTKILMPASCVHCPGLEQGCCLDHGTVKCQAHVRGLASGRC
jgi:hypothetical protein